MANSINNTPVGGELDDYESLTTPFIGSIDDLLNLSNIYNFFLHLDILKLEEVTEEYEENTNDFKKSEDFFESFDSVLKGIETIQKQNPIFGRLLDHDLRNSLQFFQPTCEKSGREYMMNWLKSDKENKKVYDDFPRIARKFLAFLESAYFIIPILEPIGKERRRNFSLQDVLHTAELDKPSLTTTFNSDRELYGIKGDYIIFLMNIFRNALKHGGATKLETSLDGNTLVIKDNGTGIPDVILPHIFKSGTSGGGSTGLGLRDLEKRGIVARASNDGLPNSQGGFGARFEIDLPISQKV